MTTFYLPWEAAHISVVSAQGWVDKRPGLGLHRRGCADTATEAHGIEWSFVRTLPASSRQLWTHLGRRCKYLETQTARREMCVYMCMYKITSWDLSENIAQYNNPITAVQSTITFLMLIWPFLSNPLLHTLLPVCALELPLLCVNPVNPVISEPLYITTQVIPPTLSLSSHKSVTTAHQSSLPVTMHEVNHLCHVWYPLTYQLL